MYEAENKNERGLEHKTLRRLREVFAGQICSACSAAAAKLCEGQFFCQDHYPKAEKICRQHRVYRCQAAVEG
ncbi:MAG: hypothetical protein K8U57_06910 [Planctomycetes bacterium]|nr:hypothetical protein [Planctomycetota bacterium]